MQHPSIEKAFVDADYNLQAGNPHKAVECANKALMTNPDDPDALYMAAVGLSHINLFAMAASVLRQCVAIKPDFWQAWNNLGNCFQEQHPYQALAFYRKAIEHSDGEKWEPLANAANASSACGRHAEAVGFAEKALRINPMGQDAHNGLGLACLHLGRWDRGWRAYSRSYGNKWRRQRDYHKGGQETPLWVPNTTSPEHTIVLHGEQGPGDEAMFSRLLHRAINTARDAGAKVVIECHPQMERIFSETFAFYDGVDVYGTRLDEMLVWAAQDHDVTHKLPFGSLPMHFLDVSEDAAPYHRLGSQDLVVPKPDQDMARAFIEARKRGAAKMTCGIAWNGGSVETGWKHRSLTIEEVFWLCDECPDIDFFELEYQDPRPALAGKDLPDNFKQTHVHQHNKDLSLVAGFLCELDHVASVTTTVVDLAGATRKTKATVLAPTRPDWRYAATAGEDKAYWYDNVSVIRQKDETTWKPELKLLAEKLNALASLRG